VRGTEFLYHGGVQEHDQEDPDPQVDVTWHRLLAAVVASRSGELRLPRHYLDVLPDDPNLTATLDPVTDDVVIRIRR
jgi:hypothetical protein